MKSFNIKINNLAFTEKNYRNIPEECGLNNENEAEKLIAFIDEWLNEKDYVVVNTSGSTGSPKPIRLKKKAMLISAQMTSNFFDLQDGYNALLCLPMDYVAGKMMIVRAIYSGVNLLVVPPSSNPFKNIKHNIYFAAITPYQLVKSFNSLMKNKVENIIVGGAPVTKEVSEKTQILKSKVYETYGMTETCSHIALRRVNGNNVTNAFKTLDNVKLELDKRGCLKIQVPGITNEMIVTNDVVEIIDEKHFVWLGRYDHVINSGGIKIFPEQVEKKISKIIELPFFISSQPDELLGEKVVLVLEGNTLNPGEEKELYKQLQNNLSRFELPKKILFKQKFIRTDTGKIKRII